ncbi:MAG: glycosyl hydrolase [Betaproteobacteria bacterium]
MKRCFDLLVLLTVVLAGTSARAQDVHYGVNAHEVSASVADSASDLGAGIVRVVFGWDVIEPGCKGCFNWSATDRWRDEARRTGRLIFGSLAYAPAWANGGHHYNYPPLDMADWYDFVYAVADRYKDDIVLWGVWNEPNLDAYLHGADLQTYERLVRTARLAIRAANPEARVLGPEVSHHAIKSGWFAAAMNAFGDQFDIVTVHWYPDGPPLEKMMDQQVRPLSQRKDVWLTEVGMKPCESHFGEAGQALFYDRVLRAFEARRDWWTATIFYDLYDPPQPLDCGAGIVRPDWSNRPAFELYQRFIRAYP